MVHTVERNFSLFDQDQPFSFWLKICAISCISINSFANSDDADPYLSEKIDVAVEAASESGLPDVGHIWYNRSTANSFNLPKMLTTEMDKLHIEGAMGPTAAGQAAEAEKLKPVADVALDKIDKSEDLSVIESTEPRGTTETKEPPETFLLESEAETAAGRFKVTEARGKAVIEGKIRP